MNVDRKMLLTGAALTAALGVGFGVARVTDAPPPKAGDPDHAEEHEEGEADFVRLTPQQAAAAGVSIVTVAQGGAGDLRLTGRVAAAPDAHAVIGSPVSGLVQRLLVSPGGQVEAGAGLIAIRSPEGATVTAEVRAAQAEAQAARSAFAREDGLLKAGVVSRQDWEAARTASARASANAVAAQARSSALGSPNSAGEVIVRTPIAGVVTAVQVSPGGYVTQGAALADVANPLRLEVVFSASAEVAAQLKHGGALRIIGPDGSEASAVIVGIAPLAQDTTGAAVIRARSNGGRLTPGSAVSASVRNKGGSALSVPSEAVQSVAGRTVVFVAVANGFTPRSVTVGRSGAGYSEIVAGLTGAERIAGRGAFLLKAELSKGEAEHEH